MSGDARALPLRDTPVGSPAAGSGRRVRGRRAGAMVRASRAQWLGAICLLAIVAGSLLVVVIGADRPSIVSPTTHAGFFPRWMAGPLGGAWPGLTRNTTELRWLFSGAIVAMYVAYLLALRYGPTLPARVVIAAVVLVHHLNPYTTIPILEPHSDPSYAVSNWHQLLSPYGPLFTLLTFAVVPLGVAASFWALKVILVAASLATIALVWRCARLLGRDPVTAIVLVGLNPIVLVWGLGGDHNDSLMLLLIVLGFFLLLRARSDPPASPSGRGRWLLPLSPAEVAAGCAFVAAAAIKASAAVLIPVVLAGLLRSRASLIAFGLHVPDLSTQSRLVTNESVPNLIGLAIGAGGETESLRLVLSAVLAMSVLACCVYAWRRQESLRAAGWASVALLVTLSWVLPWYVLWVLPLAALSGSRRLRAATAVLGAYLILSWAPASTLVWSAIGFHPEKTSLGRLHQRYVKELLN